MGVIERVIGMPGGTSALGAAATGLAEIFTENATRRMELQAEVKTTALTQFSHETSGSGYFESFVNGLNRLPRPLLALGTMGLFAYAMIEPVGFGIRMQGLQLVPEPLWWLIGAVVGFYFGAREAHYFRRRGAAASVPMPLAQTEDAVMTPPAQPHDAFSDNAALRDWADSLRQ